MPATPFRELPHLPTVESFEDRRNNRCGPPSAARLEGMSTVDMTVGLTRSRCRRGRLPTTAFRISSSWHQAVERALFTTDYNARYTRPAWTGSTPRHVHRPAPHSPAWLRSQRKKTPSPRARKKSVEVGFVSFSAPDSSWGWLTCDSL